MKELMSETGEADWKAAEKATVEFYRAAGLPPPSRFVRVRNPVLALRVGELEEPGGNMFFAPSWAGAAAVAEHRGVQGFKPLVDLLKACGGLYPTRDLAILIDRPSLISLDTNQVLHSENGPALAWGREPNTGEYSSEDPEYFAMFYTHGKRIH